MHKESLDEVYIDELLQKVLKAGFDELHLFPNSLPLMQGKNVGQPVILDEYEVMRRAQAQRIIYDIMSDEQIVEIENNGVIFLHYFGVGIGYFNVFATRTEHGVISRFRFVTRENRL